MNTLKDTILNIVEHKKIQMIPRWKFILYSSFGIIGFLFSFLSLLFVVSLILFLLLKYGFMYLPFFGVGAILHILTGVPAVLGILGIILAVLTEILGRQYAFSFRKPLLTTLLWIILSALVIGFLVSISPFHNAMRSFAKSHHIDGFRDIYERPTFNEGLDGRVVIRGEVLATTTTSVTLSLFNNVERTVYATTTGDTFPNLVIGDDIVVFGILTNNKIEVMKIRISPEMPFENRRNEGMKNHMMFIDQRRSSMMK